jgi:phosphoglycerate dehydrogenase-like enzyme
VKEIKPMQDVAEIYDGDEDRIVAIDPDFCSSKVENEDLVKIPHLKAVCLQTTSFSWIDTNFLKSKRIPVMNLRGFSSEAVAEWAFLMTLNVARKIPLVVQNGWKYNYNDHTGIELKGRKAGIIGLGSIGTRIAELCKGFGMEVLYWSKNTKDERFEYVELDELMKNSDVILPAVAQNEDTQSLITDEMLLSMKQDAIFVSIVHKIYNHDLLLKLVEEGKVYGYANEEEDSKLSEIKGNIWTGLQLGWCTKESMTRNANQWAESIVKATSGDYSTQVNK